MGEAPKGWASTGDHTPHLAPHGEPMGAHNVPVLLGREKGEGADHLGAGEQGGPLREIG